MLDIKLIRDNPDLVKAGAHKKRFPAGAEAVDRVLAVDAELRALIPDVDGRRAEQKAAGKALGTLSDAERPAFLEQQKVKKAELQQLEKRQKELEGELQEQMLLVPQVPAEEVPDGADDGDNIEVRKVGELPKFEFEPRSHDDLAEAQGWLDTKRAGELSGSRNYYLLGDLALLHDAVLRYAVDHMAGKGFTPVDPPLLVRDPAMRGTGFFPGGEDQAYRIEKDELNLIGTAEIPVTAFHSGEILSEDDLPKKYVGRSACFRREAGTYGKDTKGLYRVHQFHKVEQVIIDVADEAKSLEHHAAIVQNAEDVLQALGLPYRVVNVCGGDLGVPQVMKYDIECWMPSRESYGETHSASRFHEFQARRLGLRYRMKDAKRPLFCHTLNNTVVASPRLLIPLLEIHQQADGTVRVPEPLQPYLGGRATIGKPLD